MTDDITALEAAATSARETATRLAAAGALDDETRERVARAHDTLHVALDLLAEIAGDDDITDE